LGDGSQFGIKLSYAVQPSPDGLAQAFIIGEKFIGDEPCAMILGDNIFYGNGLGNMLKSAAKRAESGRATVFGFYVMDPERFGVVEFDKQYKALSIEEKPVEPKSNYAVTGLYFYPAGVSQMAKQVKPSARGELEITTLNQMYLQKEMLDCDVMGRGYSWLDTGTMDSLIQAGTFVQTIQNMQGIIVAAPEEIAYRYKMISREQLIDAAEKYGKSPYGHHLRMVAEGRMPK
jgi:glucose-1-phosphate thymidylyltransferase